MATTINITSIKIREVIFLPNEETALSVSYELLDSAGNVLYTKRKTIDKTDLPAATLTTLTSFASKILTKLEGLEL